MNSATKRTEFITSGRGPADEVLAPGVEVRVFAASSTGARNLCTAMASLRPNCELPMHTHPCGEAMVVVEGAIMAQIEDRRYRLNPLDSLFVPSGVPHLVGNASSVSVARVHVSFPSGSPTRELSDQLPAPKDYEAPPPEARESLRRFAAAEPYELAPDTEFRDLFAGRFGSLGICGGHGWFPPGSSLPCHVHAYDESISIIEGEAYCQAAGRKHRLSDCDTACVPEGTPHRFINNSDQPMAMIWVYAGDEPDREIVDQQQCELDQNIALSNDLPTTPCT